MRVRSSSRRDLSSRCGDEHRDVRDRSMSQREDRVLLGRLRVVALLANAGVLHEKQPKDTSQNIWLWSDTHQRMNWCSKVHKQCCIGRVCINGYTSKSLKRTSKQTLHPTCSTNTNNTQFKLTSHNPIDCRDGQWIIKRPSVSLASVLVQGRRKVKTQGAASGFMRVSMWTNYRSQSSF